MPYAKTPELERLRRQRLSVAKLGKKRPPFSQAWIDNISKGNRRFWSSLTLEERKKRTRNFVIAGQIALSKKPKKSPQERSAAIKLYRQTHKKELYALNRKWVAEHLERRREIARNSERRRAEAKKLLNQNV